MKYLFLFSLLLIVNFSFSQQRTGFLVSSVSFGTVEGKAHGDLTFSKNLTDARITVKVVPEENSIVEDFKYLDFTFSISDLELISDNPGGSTTFKGKATDSDGLVYDFTCKLAKNGSSLFILPQLQLKFVGSEVCKFTDTIK